MGGKVAIARLRAAGYDVVHHDSHFAQDAPDVEWLPWVGDRGWIVICRDKGIRRRANERAAFRAAGAKVFTFGSGNLSGAEAADILVHVADKMLALADSIASPFCFVIHRDGRLERIELLPN